MTSLVFRLCYNFGFRVCDSFSFRVSVTTLVFRVGEKLSFRVCVNFGFRSVRQVRVTSLVFPICVTNLVFQSVWQV